jgi:hypothetical protein
LPTNAQIVAGVVHGGIGPNTLHNLFWYDYANHWIIPSRSWTVEVHSDCAYNANSQVSREYFMSFRFPNFSFRFRSGRTTWGSILPAWEAGGGMNGRKGRGKTTEFGWNSTETETQHVRILIRGDLKSFLLRPLPFLLLLLLLRITFSFSIGGSPLHNSIRTCPGRDYIFLRRGRRLACTHTHTSSYISRNGG